MTKTLSEQRKRAEGKSVSVPVKSELSRQLCEIVGLEYKNKMFLSDGEVECTYLDFEQPNNFVKLWEIINNQSKQELIQRLINRLRTEGGWYAEEQKQSIRDYDDWVWG